MIDYSKWTADELKAAQAAIEYEIKRRTEPGRWPVVLIDPAMPPGTMEIWQGPHRVRVTGLADDSQGGDK